MALRDRLRGGGRRRCVPRLDSRQDDGRAKIARSVRHPDDGRWWVDAAGPRPYGRPHRQVVAREPAQAAGTGPVSRIALRLLRHRRRLPDRAVPNACRRDADSECSRLVARVRHRIRADHCGQLCLVRAGGLAACRPLRNRRAARRPAWRALGKIARQPPGCADDSVRDADLRCSSLHVGSQPQRDLRSQLMDPLRNPSKGNAHTNKISIFARVWPSMVAGLAGSVAHSSLMFLKSWSGFLPSFRPYDDLQRALSDLIGSSVPPVVSWVLSFANGSLVLGFLFSRTYRLLPGRNGAVKGLVFGVLGWIAMGLFFFPPLGRGLFATQAGLDLLPGHVLHTGVASLLSPVQGRRRRPARR